MKLRRTWLGTLLAAGALLAACSGNGDVAETSTAPAVASYGVELFNERVIGSNPGCITCHSLESGIELVGPSLFGIGDTAAERIAGVAAADYLRQSILDPDAFIVPGYESGQMVGGWSELLTAAQIDSLVEYLQGL
jgi:cytochrome c551/c552